MKKQAITRLLSITLFLGLSFGLISCLGQADNPEKEEKIQELTMKVDAAELQLLQLLTSPNGIDKEAVQDTLKSMRETNQAILDLKETGGSWWDIGKGALGGVFGRTLLHAARAALIAFFPATAGGGIASVFGLMLGGSGTGGKKD